MFKWFSKEEKSSGLRKMRTELGQMLDAGKHIFDTAANAFLGGTDLEVIRKDLFTTDKRINKAERQIRRELVVHASVHGEADFPACLVLMSIVKDAERLGDYAKNVFDLAEMAPEPPSGEHRERLIGLKNQISQVLSRCREVFDEEEEGAAKELIRDAHVIEDECDEEIRKLIRGGNGEGPMGPTYVLAYRYFKRITSHLRNISSSIVQPLHKIDFTAKIVKKMEAEDAIEAQE